MYIQNITSNIRKTTINDETLSLKTIIGELDFLKKPVVIQ